MIALLLMLAADPALDKAACIGWRDPDTGKTLNARELRDRDDKMRQRMLNNEASDRSVIDLARKPPECVLRAASVAKEKPQ